MSNSEIAISIADVSRMFKRYRHNGYQVMDALGLPLPKNAYDEFWALRAISLEVRRGESLGLIGQNGAGKSTLLNIVCGRLRPTSGSIKVLGTIQALMDIGTGFHPEFTGRENIFSALAYQGVTGRAARAEFEDIVEFSELADFIDQPVKTYSSGMYARLAFSTATAITPDVLIIDEVLGAGDAYFSAKCVERMRRLMRDTGATVLFVSHDIGAVQRTCDRAVWIDHGRIRMEGKTLDISKAYYADVNAREEARLRAKTTLAISAMRQRLVGNHTGASLDDGSLPRAMAENLDGEGADADENQPADSKWETAEARFLAARPCNADTRGAQYIFRLGEPLLFKIAVELRVSLPMWWLACSLYDHLGNRVISAIHHFEEGADRGRYDLEVRFDPVNLRQGDYVVSLDALPMFDPNWRDDVRLPYLCHWDRCVYFKIEEDYHGVIPLGIVAVPIAVSVHRTSDDSLAIDVVE
jgi:ABC-type polysaccharide/polyol phosphate transport system ATPase subunit